jgi:hypothetical protein
LRRSAWKKWAGATHEQMTKTKNGEPSTIAFHSCVTVDIFEGNVAKNSEQKGIGVAEKGNKATPSYTIPHVLVV